MQYIVLAGQAAVGSVALGWFVNCGQAELKPNALIKHLDPNKVILGSAVAYLALHFAAPPNRNWQWFSPSSMRAAFSEHLTPFMGNLAFQVGVRVLHPVALRLMGIKMKAPSQYCGLPSAWFSNLVSELALRGLLQDIGRNLSLWVGCSHHTASGLAVAFQALTRAAIISPANGPNFAIHASSAIPLAIARGKLREETDSLLPGVTSAIVTSTVGQFAIFALLSSR